MLGTSGVSRMNLNDRTAACTLASWSAAVFRRFGEPARNSSSPPFLLLKAKTAERRRTPKIADERANENPACLGVSEVADSPHYREPGAYFCLRSERS